MSKGKTIFIAARAKVLQALAEDTEFLNELDKVKNLTDLAKLIEKYCKKHGYKVGEVRVE